MGVLMQIREVPEDVHRTLKVRAAAKGVSLSEYVRELLREHASRPTTEELSDRIKARGRVELDEPAEAYIRHIRDAAG